MQQLIELYIQWKGCAPQTTEALAKAGSNRQYVRLTATDGASVIGVIGTSLAENDCFVRLSRHFSGQGLPVPTILAVSEDGARYLQTDLGGTSLYDAIKAGRESGGAYSDAERELIRRTIRLLPHIQVEGARGLDFSRLLTPTHFDERAAMFDLNYFKYCFLRTTDLAFDEVRLQNDLESLAADLVACGKGDTFLFRDFQSRNVMLQDGEPFVIDFQGGRCGPLHYDVASFLWQASARFSEALREEMVEAYLDELAMLRTIDKDAFRRELRLFVMFRLLQVLGAYGLRGRFERKK